MVSSIIKRKLKVSIVGAGPAGFALAVDLESRGMSVLVYSHPDHSRHAKKVLDRGCLTTNGLIEVTAYPRITFDMGEAVEFSKFILLTLPTTGQGTIVKELTRFCLRQHTIVAVPGNLITRVLEAAKIEVECIIETNLSPYSCRMNDDGDLSILGTKKLFHIAGDRKYLTPAIINKVEGIFAMVELRWCTNIVEACLSNINGVFHPLMMLMNIGRIENTAGDFFLYSDGLTRSVSNAMLAVDAVRIKIGQAFGFQLKSAIGTSNECYGHDFTDLVDLAQASKPHRNLKAPPNVNNRNITEDIPYVLVIWHDLAEKLGIDASAIKAVIVMAGMATGEDYLKTGRTLAKLNLNHLSPSELIARYSAPQLYKQPSTF